MSIPAFIDIPVEEQTLELRSYLKSLGAAISSEANEAGILVDLQNIIDATDVCWKEISNTEELEMVFNGIISLILVLPSAEMQEPVMTCCQKVAKTQPGDKKSSARLKILSNLFYGLDEQSPLRAEIYVAMIKLAHQSDLVQNVVTDLDQIKIWISQWDISTQKIQNLLRCLHDALIDSKLRCIVTHLGDPNTFLMDHLLSLKPVKFLEGELIHDLLTIFVSQKLTAYQQFYKNNTDFVNSLGLSHDQNLSKMRLLTFMQMAENKKEIEFDKIHSEMQLEENEIEDFIIDVLRTKAVRAKIDQMQKKVLINSTIHRTFGKSQWQMLRQHLLQWRDNLQTVQDSLGQLDIMQSQAAAQQ
ncbi:hypothetical protein KUTeg_023367 [Tegillarca granosa]|uniref:Eukaryotic translation initiation factor 3 subunit M n=1 Tax=Tegillarca granosa TaxID=220873 RepID=A0ABQ9E6Y6_TEGGR|nr:hypothetical protein KUTeg_023367 [Tegillarca granosa]